MVPIESPDQPPVSGERRPARRSGTVAIIAIVLVLLTGSVAGALSNTVRHPLRVDPSEHSGRIVLLANDYYEQLDQLLSGKSSDGLKNVIADEYAGHQVGRTELESAAALLARLDSLHAIFPKAHLETRLISTSRDTAVAQVTLRGTAGGSVMGIPIAPIAETPHIETLRFEGDRLAERWAAPLPIAVDMLGTARYTPASAGSLQPYLERITLAAGGHVDLAANSPHLVFVESGALRIESKSSSIYAAAPAVSVNEGETTIVAGAKPSRVVNSGSEPASFLLLRIENDNPGIARPEAQQQTGGMDQGVTARVMLAGAPPADVDPEPWTFSIARVMLQPGVALATHQVAGTEMVVVESGELIAVGDNCAARCIETSGGTTAVVSGDLFLQKSQGFAAQNATVSYEGAGSGATTLLLIVISHSSRE